MMDDDTEARRSSFDDADMNAGSGSSGAGPDRRSSITDALSDASSSDGAHAQDHKKSSSMGPRRSSLRLQRNLGDTDNNSSGCDLERMPSVTFGNMSDYSISGSGLDLDTGSSAALNPMGSSEEGSPMTGGDEHRNDKNDSTSTLSFKEFRRSLSILKRSLNQVDFDPDDFDFDCSDSDDETDAHSVSSVQNLLQQSEDDCNRPSSYAHGTSQRSMRSLGRKSKLPLDCNQRTKLKWLKSFYRLDPRWQICNFFDDLAHEGLEGIDESGRIQLSSLPFIMRAFSRVGVFSVWRPTSNEAIRRMITGEGTGKGMDIKGKSAIKGKFSGFVPFLQIHRNEDKLKVGSLHADARVRVFYPNKISRDRAFMSLAMVRDKMREATQRSMRFIAEVEQKEVSVLGEEMNKSMRNLSHTSMRLAIGSTRRRLNSGPDAIDYAQFEAALEAEHRNCMLDNADVYKIDDYASTKGCYGLDIPEKLFWETFVSKTDISREDGSEYDSGRASMPEFQVMNLESLRKAPKTGPCPVLWHAGCGKVGEEAPQHINPLCPFGLLMAYEEAAEADADTGKVTPVVSDFDCFLVGTRRVEYRDPLGEQELSMLKWCVDEVEGILDNTEEGKCWTRHWLDVKKKYAFDPRFQIPMPKMGYADPRSSAMLKGAVYSLRQNGAVRHGPECFNYSFPQHLDDKFLVISDTLPGLVPWKYVDIEELMEILADKIDEGFAFPLNPKWVLCDEGWKDLYDKLLASEAPNVQDAMNVWYPTDVRERIAAISSKHPSGFSPSEEAQAIPAKSQEPTRRPTVSTDLEQHELEVFKSQKDVTSDTAELELERYKHARSGVEKIRRALLKKKKTKKDTFFSTALVMLQIGKEADARIKKTGSEKVLDRFRSSLSLSGSKHDVQRRSSLTVATTTSVSSEGSVINCRPSRRKSFTRYLRKRLSNKKKKLQRQNTM
eukprot:CAMPEP_0113381314 /NCGR_PEP_ID=MMETSP0013_2-20120614/5229_1 /TAXON_ID=2843 ORGANISM="Skeletonema costatum, Strain 1716" /NCGR_SAMPLE_ID=MMETSP0013_2 /ASSEMBLY_ACC=CAM_ASM_000158 /LENGTH=945 /DNA_ID=CAMNT_0000263719 /DNA_START=15 /DNA_END=2852 /DNA_ORIENTATION=+ /assembly_acc=CAM_ASM_000158